LVVVGCWLLLLVVANSLQSFFKDLMQCFPGYHTSVLSGLLHISIFRVTMTSKAKKIAASAARFPSDEFRPFLLAPPAPEMPLDTHDTIFDYAVRRRKISKNLGCSLSSEKHRHAADSHCLTFAIFLIA
jgi:hypothetical protein